MILEDKNPFAPDRQAIWTAGRARDIAAFVAEWSMVADDFRAELGGRWRLTGFVVRLPLPMGRPRGG